MTDNFDVFLRVFGAVAIAGVGIAIPLIFGSDVMRWFGLSGLDSRSWLVVASMIGGVTAPCSFAAYKILFKGL